MRSAVVAVTTAHTQRSAPPKGALVPASGNKWDNALVYLSLAEYLKAKALKEEQLIEREKVSAPNKKQIRYRDAFAEVLTLFSDADALYLH